jgi:hypothetical protein
MGMNAEKRVRLEMSETTLRSLLTAGQVCAADFRCLDCESKKCLWRLCLESCVITVPDCRGGDSLEDVSASHWLTGRREGAYRGDPHFVKKKP